jgi:hypothetical protein
LFSAHFKGDLPRISPKQGKLYNEGKLQEAIKAAKRLEDKLALL